MKEIDVKPRRVATYGPLFIWGLSAFCLAWVVLGLWAFEWDLRLLVISPPLVMLGILMGIRFRDTP